MCLHLALYPYSCGSLLLVSKKLDILSIGVISDFMRSKVHAFGISNILKSLSVMNKTS